MTRSWLLGAAGGVMLASIVGDVPIWLILVAAALIAWDVATIAAKALVQ
ncbi:hypothetical protein HH308_06155 [Gordonia sp. TBRC 11910]|uniref:Uncharacterized protein n=1 Tax=Gordonia asplenii TaxID=2725283 RepID=A0A848KP24_9ACTN|nr:hypothetical protein [Gordonia asplenii]NMO00794.1 hypothetical protein [Gordonia asplenii]